MKIVNLKFVDIIKKECGLFTLHRGPSACRRIKSQYGLSYFIILNN